MASERRQRADGTWTYATPEWDHDWYWPVGTRVELQDGGRTRAGKYKGLHGTVTKQNPVSANVTLDGTGEVLKRVPFEALKRS